MAIAREDMHEAWKQMRRNLTERDLYPKRPYPLWINPATGKPCRSAPKPYNEKAPPLRAVSTADPDQDEYARARRLGVRQRLNRRLTEKQKRRIMMVRVGEKSERAVAKEEGASQQAMQFRVQEAEAKLSRDGYLWLLWLL